MFKHIGDSERRKANGNPRFTVRALMQCQLGVLSRASLAVLLAFTISGCTTPQPEARETVVASGDCLFIVFTHEPSIPGLRRVVDAKGDIDLPLNVKLHVAGMTLAQVESAIPARYVPCVKDWKPSVFKGSK
jgi:protein involved in polysaccharide export with SLBB domain